MIRLVSGLLVMIGSAPLLANRGVTIILPEETVTLHRDGYLEPEVRLQIRVQSFDRTVLYEETIPLNKGKRATRNISGFPIAFHKYEIVPDASREKTIRVPLERGNYSRLELSTVAPHGTEATVMSMRLDLERNCHEIVWLDDLFPKRFSVPDAAVPPPMRVPPNQNLVLVSIAKDIWVRGGSPLGHEPSLAGFEGRRLFLLDLDAPEAPIASEFALTGRGKGFWETSFPLQNDRRYALVLAKESDVYWREEVRANPEQRYMLLTNLGNALWLQRDERAALVLHAMQPYLGDLAALALADHILPHEWLDSVGRAHALASGEGDGKRIAWPAMRAILRHRNVLLGQPRGNFIHRINAELAFRDIADQLPDREEITRDRNFTWVSKKLSAMILSLHTTVRDEGVDSRVSTPFLEMKDKAFGPRYSADDEGAIHQAFVFRRSGDLEINRRVERTRHENRRSLGSKDGGRRLRFALTDLGQHTFYLATYSGSSGLEHRLYIREGMWHLNPMVSITRVLADSNAHTAGLLEGDLVLRYNNKPTFGLASLISLVAEHAEGTGTVPVSVLRQGQTLQLRVPRGKMGVHLKNESYLVDSSGQLASPEGWLVHATELPEPERTLVARGLHDGKSVEGRLVRLGKGLPNSLEVALDALIEDADTEVIIETDEGQVSITKPRLNEILSFAEKAD